MLTPRRNDDAMSPGHRALRPVQELAAGPILDGCNAVVLAPTAGGKTEAAFFPLLTHGRRGLAASVALVYVAPIPYCTESRTP